MKQELDTEIIVATARGSDATGVSANVVVDERQMNALFLDLVSILIFLSCLEHPLVELQTTIIHGVICYEMPFFPLLVFLIGETPASSWADMQMMYSGPQFKMDWGPLLCSPN